MLEWNVAEDEWTALPEEVAASPAAPLWQRWWPWLVLWVVLFGVLGGMVWWRVREQEQTLRTALQGVVDAETRLMANGVPDDALDAARAVADPSVAVQWLNRYWYQFVGRRPIPQAPQVSAVRLQEGGMVAQVEVAWILPEETPGLRVATEERAYRLVDGAWRRMPLALTDVAREEARTTGVILTGAPDDLMVLEQLDIAGLRAHLAERWPRTWLESAPLYVTVQPKELGFVIASAPTNRQTIVVNSPALAVSQLALDMPLPADTQYRFLVTSEVMRRLTMPSMTMPSWERPFTVSAILSALKEAEARHWTLTLAEQRALRNRWRTALGGEWPSPLEGAFYRSVVNSPRQRARTQRQEQALALALDWLVAREGVDVLGRLAHELNAGEDDFAVLASGATGMTAYELERELRTFALADEAVP